jgi:hypothetical protein
MLIPMSDRPVWIRRLVMPLVILAVAGGLAVWNTHRRQVQAVDVQRLVTDLCDDLAAGRDPSPHLRGTDTLITGPLLARLRSVLDTSGGPDKVTIVAEPGDTEVLGTAGQEATHTALLLVDGRAVLGLRVLHPGSIEDIAIIGFWVPQAP